MTDRSRAMRSRTGCLTCRQRKLKCDEQKPVCGQCTKAKRQCQPSSGLTFRHQHNASMNANAEGSWPDRNPELSGFYTYKNSFDASTVWLDVPKELTFFNITNPYLEPGTPERDGQTSSPYQPPYTQNEHDSWYMHNQPQGQQNQRLEVLSAAALSTTPESSTRPQMGLNYQDHFEAPFGLPSTHKSQKYPLGSPGAKAPPSSTLNTPELNPKATTESPIDPSLVSPVSNHVSSPQHGITDTQKDVEEYNFGEAESERKVAYLLRHFSESPGEWMDLFDSGKFFGSYVPMQTHSNPVLKHAVCAYASKHLARVEGAKMAIRGDIDEDAERSAFGDCLVDWQEESYDHYDRTIALLVDTKQPAQDEGKESNLWLASEVVAAAAILREYELFSDKLAVGSCPLYYVLKVCLSSLGAQRQEQSNINITIFWTLARQDFNSAFVQGRRTQLDTNNLQIWRDAGLSLDEDGFLLPDSIMKMRSQANNYTRESMLSNALVWLLCRLCNHVAAVGGFHPLTFVNHLPSINEDDTANSYEEYQHLFEQWEKLRYQFDAWLQDLPTTFKPSPRTRSKIQRPFTDVEIIHPLEKRPNPFDEIWYSFSSHAATMMYYHMAWILLLLTKPQESAARRGTIGTLARMSPGIQEQIIYHCYEVCGIASSRPAAAARINATQPLYVAGLCLTHHRERKAILDLLKGIEADLGWPTQSRVQQLEKEWGWVTETRILDH